MKRSYFKAYMARQKKAAKRFRVNYRPNVNIDTKDYYWTRYSQVFAIWAPLGSFVRYVDTEQEAEDAVKELNAGR